jgi:flagellar motor protein MotB
MTYIKPDNYQWKKEKFNKEIDDALIFPNTTNHAWLKQIKVGDKETDDVALIKEEGSNNIYSLVFSGGTCIGDGCSLDENIISVVIPARYKILTYQGHTLDSANNSDVIKRANVKQIKNTITLYAKNVTGAAFVLRVQDRLSSSTIYNNVSTSMKKYSDIKVENKDNETKITLPMDNVFDSGSSIAKPIGKEWLATLTKSLKGKNYKEIRVEGHTDSSPIKSAVYPSNWELSTARASDAVRTMIENGVPANKIVAVGYGETRPVIDNKTEQNKAKNRRIEITIVGAINK